MFTKIFTFLNSTRESFIILWKYPVISSEIYSLNLGILISGFLFLLVGTKIIKIFMKKAKNRFLKNINDNATRIWISNFLFYLLLFLLVISISIYMGFSIQIIKKVWTTSIFTISDNPIKISSLVLGILFFLFGLRLSKYFSLKFQNSILEHFNIDLATRKTLEKILRYILIILTSLFSLSIIGIPLTAFTVIGGAFAIGIGFGSQNLVNNFLSGLVLTIERPVKVGDIVEVENKLGTIESIGARSTIIKTYDNLRVVLPNSKLLENTVVNWSLIDQLIRRKLTIGIAYGSDVIKAKERLEFVAEKHRQIVQNPKPLVLFSDFGDSALIFDLLFWTKLTSEINPLQIESDLRFSINQLFAEENIEIAFPQMDVHIKNGS